MDMILIVEDDPGLRDLLSTLLQRNGYATVVTDVEDTALGLVRERVPKLVLLDIQLPATNGLELLKKMREIDRGLSIVMMTGHGDISQAVQAIKLGALDFIAKPFNIEELLVLIRNTLRDRSLSTVLEHLETPSTAELPLEKIFGTSPRISHVLNQVRIIAPTDITVLIQGESGTGKELITNLLRRFSTRSEKPFVAVDCGAVPDTLFEGEFFGCEKGAFTGADAAREGKFEQANGGTIFLDEIANIPDGIQMKLLRVLEEKKINRLGGRRAIAVDVRVIVASNIDLAEAVKQGKFRQDLYHRLNQFPIFIPPLRERREDIPLLSSLFLEKANREFGKHVEGFSPEATRCLEDYEWPGNIRELKNVIKRAVLLAHTGSITIADLSLDITNPKDGEKGVRPCGSAADAVPKPRGEGRALKDTLRDVERETLRDTLARTGGSKAKTAEILGLNRKALYRKLKSFELST